MSANRLMATLSGLLDRTRLAEETLVAGLSADERAAAGTLERWSAKDLIAHVTAWHTNLAETLEAALAGETPPRPRVDEANARTFEENAHKSWQQVQAEAEAVLGRVQGLLAQFGDEDLLNPDRYPWRRGHALAPVVTLRLYWHPHVHLGEFYAQRGDRVPAEAVRADLLRAAGELAWVPLLRGYTLYMVACTSAALGEREAALAALGESLALAPELTEWSQQDPSLAAVR